MNIKPVYIAVKRIKDIYFSINEQLFVPDPNKIVKIELGQRIGFALEHNLVNFILRIFYHYVGDPEILVDTQVENLFEVSDLRDYLTKDGIIILPADLITSIVGISLSHGRALMCKNTIGTKWEEVILPITNPRDVAAHFYPYMFGQEAVVHLTDESGKKEGDSISLTKKKSKAVKS
jgi:hypothetical protein